MKKSLIKKYAELIVKVGANVQKGQDVMVYAEIDQEELVSYIVSECYKVKARLVRVEWSSSKISKITNKKASINALSHLEDFVLAKQQYLTDKLPAMIHITSEDPDAMKGVDQAKLSKVRRNIYPLIKPYRDARDNKYQWVIAGAPSKAWAKKVFPDLPASKAMEKLYEAILFTSRVDENDIKNWEKHNANFLNHCKILNDLHLKELRYKSSNGTDFKVGLIENANFLGGGETTLGGVYFNPNIPTEECFTSPKKGEAEGIVYSTKPLSYNGELIEDFSIRFHKGKAVEVKAKKGESLLKEMISMDEGASYLGECALVPFSSPINKSGILFYNTLYDENAVCHLALGTGFPNVIKDFEKYDLKTIHEMGVNESMIHVDFMIGSKDLSIIGVTKEGKEVTLFKDGEWAI